jgi:flagellar motor switch/type III secretory pathway protein FliN
MALRKAVTAYPWQSLDRVTRRSVRSGAAVRRRVERAVNFGALASALGAVAGSEIEIVVRRISAAEGRPVSLGTTLAFELGDGSTVLDLSFEPELATLLLSRVLGRAPPLSATTTALDPALRGALAAVLIEACRRTRAEIVLRVAEQRNATLAPEQHADAALVEATLLIDGQPFPLRAWAQIAHDPTRDSPAPGLGALGELTISLPLVIGAALATRSELGSLERGDAWLAGPGWWIDGSGAGRGALMASPGELGVAVDLASDGRIVVRGDRVALSSDPNGAMADSDPTTIELADVVLDQPIVVRVELGAVTLTAREWAALRAGDVIETGRRVAEPVTLRVAGREVARGELVNVEGELGVRILQVLTGARDA